MFRHPIEIGLDHTAAARRQSHQVGTALWPVAAIALLVLLPSCLLAQTATRAADIEAAREKKAGHLKPDEPSKIERILRDFRDNKMLERSTAGIAGFRVKFGGLVQGSGFALGPEYLRQDLVGGNLIFRTAAQISTHAFQRYDAQISAPHFAHKLLFFDLFGVHHDYRSINYYGPGAESKRSSRTDSRIIDTAIDGTLGIQPIPHLRLGVSSGYLFVNLGPGKDSRFASTDKVFSPSEAVGIDTRPDFVRIGTFARFDYRDNPGGPRSGGDYLVQWDRFLARPSGLNNDFRRLNVEVQQYIPFFNRRRVIALHGQSVLTYPDGANVVPFYLQPTLGGSEDLRGFRPFRFYDNNLILVNGEYRWEVFSGLDMALFADAGKVFRQHANWNVRNMEADFGFGFRFNVRNNVFLRIDTGFSHEGFQIWFKFGNVFGEERIRTSRFQ